MPDFQNFYSIVPIEIKNFSRAIFLNQINFPGCSANKFTVICKFFGINLCQIHIFSQNNHSEVADVTIFTLATFNSFLPSKKGSFCSPCYDISKARSKARFAVGKIKYLES